MGRGERAASLQKKKKTTIEPKEVRCSQVVLECLLLSTENLHKMQPITPAK